MEWVKVDGGVEKPSTFFSGEQVSTYPKRVTPIHVRPLTEALKLIGNASIGPRQTDIHLRDAFGKCCRILRDLRDRQQIRIRMNRRRGWNIEFRRQDAVSTTELCLTTQPCSTVQLKITELKPTNTSSPTVQGP